MSIENVFYPRAIKIREPGSPLTAFDITQFESLVTDRNFQQVTQSSAGDFAPCFQGLSGHSPSISFETSQLPSLLNMFKLSTFSQQNIITDVSAGNVDVVYAAGRVNAIRELDTALLHLIGTLTANAAVYWTAMQAQQDQVATLSTMIKTSGTAPGISALSFLADQDLVGPDASPTACDSFFTLGKVFYGGVQIEGVTSVNWSNNVKTIDIRSDGDAEPCYFGIESMAPEVRVTTVDAEEIALPAVAANGHEGLQTNLLAVYLRKMARVNFFVPDATPEHILFSANAGLKIVPSLSGNPAETTLQFFLEKDSGNLVFSLNTAIAIP